MCKKKNYWIPSVSEQCIVIQNRANKISDRIYRNNEHKKRGTINL